LPFRPRFTRYPELQPNAAVGIAVEKEAALSMDPKKRRYTLKERACDPTAPRARRKTSKGGQEWLDSKPVGGELRFNEARRNLKARRKSPDRRWDMSNRAGARRC